MGPLFALVLGFLAVFLILLVLVQRGRGGGLAGALGGMGGSSAFGAKAGDIFTRITIVVVAIWITICILAVHWAKNRTDKFGGSQSGASTSSDVLPPFTAPPMGDLGTTPPTGTLDTPPPQGAPESSTPPATTPPAVDQVPATNETPREEPANTEAVPAGGTPAGTDR